MPPRCAAAMARALASAAAAMANIFSAAVLGPMLRGARGSSEAGTLASRGLTPAKQATGSNETAKVVVVVAISCELQEKVVDQKH